MTTPKLGERVDVVSRDRGPRRQLVADATVVAVTSRHVVVFRQGSGATGAGSEYVFVRSMVELLAARTFLD